MPRGFNNWKAAEVIRFLKSYRFVHSHTRGSHFYYIGEVDGKKRQVTISFHSSESIHPKTMKSIVRQSGISETEWLQN